MSKAKPNSTAQLIQAVKSKNVAEVKKALKNEHVDSILREGVSYIDRYTSETCALAEAIREQDLAMVQFLLEQNASVDTELENTVYFKDSYTQSIDTMVTLAIASSTDSNLLQLVLAKSKQINKPVAKDVEREMDFDQETGDSGMTALHVAAKRKNDVAIAILVALGADPNATTTQGKKAIDFYPTIKLE